MIDQVFMHQSSPVEILSFVVHLFKGISFTNILPSSKLIKQVRGVFCSYKPCFCGLTVGEYSKQFHQGNNLTEVLTRYPHVSIRVIYTIRTGNNCTMKKVSAFQYVIP